MGGYRWLPIFRVTPPAGASWTVDLVNDVQTAPGAGPAEIEVRVLPEGKPQRRNILGQSRPLILGYRYQLKFTVIVGPNAMSDDELVTRVINALSDGLQIVECALDGSVYRAVTLAGEPRRRPNSGKPFAGCTWEFTVETVDRVAELTPVGFGSW